MDQFDRLSDVQARYARFSAALTTAVLLEKESHLFYVHVIPAEFFQGDAWANSTEEFSIELGRAAAHYVSREFRNSVALGDALNDTIRIGVSGGRTVFGLFSEMSVDTKISATISIEPLVVGPIPHSMYSAGSIAELAKQRFIKAHVEPYSIFKLDLGVFTIENRARDDSQVASFDWVLVGIGSRDSEGLRAHLKGITYRNLEEGAVVGDVCSRLFDESGTELCPSVSDQFVRINFDQLQELSTERRRRVARVVAIAGGKNKVKPIAVLLKRHVRLFNFLITDELTARALIRELRHGAVDTGDDRPLPVPE